MNRRPSSGETANSKSSTTASQVHVRRIEIRVWNNHSRCEWKVSLHRKLLFPCLSLRMCPCRRRDAPQQHIHSRMCVCVYIYMYTGSIKSSALFNPPPFFFVWETWSKATLFSFFSRFRRCLDQKNTYNNLLISLATFCTCLREIYTHKPPQSYHFERKSIKRDVVNYLRESIMSRLRPLVIWLPNRTRMNPF